jgi:hypothetical protein
MDRIRNILGMLDEGKRIYKIEEGEVDREEFEYCQIIDQLVFGPKGFVETLGPTWNMIHDPRFNKIENTFIINRKSMFGGDARVGKQYISSDGTFSSTVADLEQYAEILGEGRHFHNVLVHPNVKCPVRKWLERIHTPTQAKPNADLLCICDGNAKENPKDVKDWSKEEVWALVKQECPNYFTREGKPNYIATRLFDLMKSDLIGMIDDYAETPLVDEWTLLDTGDIIEQTNNTDLLDVPPQVFMEVDLLEKALTYRATLRATAAKILKQLGFDGYLDRLAEKYPSHEPLLTDGEMDTLLRMIYQSNWPSDKPLLVANLSNYVAQVLRDPYNVRLADQVSRASEQSKQVIADLKVGKAECINRYTDPGVEVPQDEHANLVEAIIKNPLKQGLFLIYAEAEKRTMHNEGHVTGILAASSLAAEGLDNVGDDGLCKDSNCAACVIPKKVIDILAPIFSAPDFPLTEEGYTKFMQDVQETGFFDKKAGATHEGEFDPKQSGDLLGNRPENITDPNRKISWDNPHIDEGYIDPEDPSIDPDEPRS